VTGSDHFPPDADVLFMVNPGGDFPAGQASSIRRWVEEGNNLVLTLGQSLGDISAGFADRHPMLRELDIEYTFSGFYSATVPVAQPLFIDPPVARVVMPGAYSLQLPPEAVVLAATRSESGDRLPLAAMLPVGGGRVFVLSTDFPMSNAGLREADNGAFAYNLARMGAGNRVAFDEVHHGLSSGGDLIGLLTSTPWGWALVYASALFAAYVVWSARRLGPPLPVWKPDQRRPTSDYVRSVARLFRRARKPDYAARQYEHYFKRSLSRHAALDPNLADEQFVALLSERGRYPVDPTRMSQSLRDLRRIEFVGGGRSVEDEALEAIRDAEKVRREALGLRE
jgi:hypothetical protein